MDSIDVVIPCSNAVQTIGPIVKAFHDSPVIGQINVVVNPPDTGTILKIDSYVPDGTDIKLIFMPRIGKGQAVMAGLDDVRTDYVIFCDADYIGLTLDHIGLLASGATIDEWCMTIGVPDIPDNFPETRLWAWPWVSGFRCLPTRVIRPLRLHGYLMETQVNAAAKNAHLPVRMEWMHGLRSDYIMTDRRILDMERDAKWGRERGIL